VADRQALFEAIMDAAVTTGGAACADLQLYDDAGGVLRIAAQRGLSSQFLAFFAAVDSTAPSACARWPWARAAVLVDDVSRSPIFAGQPGRDVVLAAGTRAVYSCPLITPAANLQAVLSLHRPRPADRPDNAAFVAHCAAQALIQTSRAPAGPR
jgi:GAF domain-containing protein